MADIKYTVTVDAKGAASEIKKFDGAVKEMPASVENTNRSLGRMAGMFVAVAASAAVLFKLMKSSVSAAMVQEDADRALRASLELTGREVENNTAHFKSYASALQDATTYGDEQIQGIQTLLVQMTDLDRDGVDRATKGVLGLSSAMGMDLNAAALLVQKAMAGQFATLSRYGIVLDENLSDEEKRIQLLEKLDVLYGRATAATETFSGRVAQLKNAWGDAQEEIGKAITQNEAVRDVIQRVTTSVKELIDSGKFEEWANNAAAGFRHLINVIEEFGSLSAHISRGGSIADWLAGTVSGMSDELDRLSREGRSKVMAFRESLEFIKPSLAELRAEIEKGPKAWEAYMESMRWLDEQERRALKTTKELSEEYERQRTIVDATTEANNLIAEAYHRVAVSLAQLKPKLVDGRKAFEDMGKAAIEALTLPDFAGINWDAFFPSEKALELPPFLQDIVDGALNVQEQTVGMSDTWDSAMLSMTAGLVSFGDTNASIWSNVSAVFSNFIKSAISGMEAMYLKQLLISKGIIKAKQGEATASHIGNIFKSVPFPFDLILAAGAFAVVNALFSKLLKFEQGGVFKKPTIAEIGHGTEYVLPEAKLVNLIRAAVSGRPVGSAPAPTMAMAGVGGTTVNLYGPLLSVRELSDSNIRAAGDKLYAEVNRQARRLGRE